MDLSRCDDCCNVLGGVDDGIVYDCDEEVLQKYGFEHLCLDCLEHHSSDGELYLHTEGSFQIVKVFEIPEYDYTEGDMKEAMDYQLKRFGLKETK